MTANACRVAVVIVTHERVDDLRRCLESIAAQSVRPDETVVVAGSAGSCPDSLVDAFADLGVRVVASYERNICRARNAGLRAAASDLVLFIDDDATARAGWVASYAEMFEREAGVWMVGGHVHDARSAAGALEFAFGLVAPDGRQVEVRDPARAGKPRGYLANVKGCNFGVRRDAVLSLGGFDEFFAFGFDEADLAMRVHRTGGGVAHLPGARVDHAHSPGLYRAAGALDRDWRREYASHTVFMLKHTRGAGLLGWWVVWRRLGKLMARVLWAVGRREITVKAGLGIIGAAVRGIRDASTANRDRRRGRLCDQ